VDVFDGVDWEGPVVATCVCPDGRVIVLPGVDAGVPEGPMSFRATSRYTPTATGPHVFSMIELGRARVSIDSTVVFDGITNATPRGDAYFGIAGQELSILIDLTEGHAVTIDVEFVTVVKSWLQGVRLGCKPVPSADLMDRAVAAASRADAVIVIVGTNDDWETEGNDRATMDLPGAQCELIERVSRANRNTAIVVNAGAPVATPWAAEAPAVLMAWFGGQEMANALVDVLFGSTDPSGRLATTFPDCIEHTPSFGNFPGEHGQIRYGEGVLIGYRWYEARKLPVPYAFGHGLSYTTFALGEAHVTATPATGVDVPEGDLDGVNGTKKFDEETGVTVSVTVTNRGDRRGAEVVQCYVGSVQPRVFRPNKELKAFQKVWLDPAESTTVTFTLDARAFAYWDPGSAYKGTIIPSAAGTWHSTAFAAPGWRVDGGDYRIHIGRASDDIAHVTTIRLRGDGT
ncbi:MAG: glycoside hydrolase family 3 C-terminal domain-containing protein, partial [Ilumatobacteraceae bacterium]